MGPGFFLSRIVKSARTMTELRHAYMIKHNLHVFVMIGGILLVVTGLLMGTINTSLFQSGWYLASLTLFITALAMGPLILAPRSKPIKEILKNYQGDDIPEEYHYLSKILFRYERIENTIFVVIIVLMILKPF
jgi:uncharacterized membrane protein